MKCPHQDTTEAKYPQQSITDLDSGNMTIIKTEEGHPAKPELGKTSPNTTESIITTNQIQSSAVYHPPLPKEDQHIEVVIDTAAESTKLSDRIFNNLHPAPKICPT